MKTKTSIFGERCLTLGTKVYQKCMIGVGNLLLGGVNDRVGGKGVGRLEIYKLVVY